MIEGIFGSVIFGKALGRIQTFEEIERRYSGRFGSHEVHMAKPLLEWAGNDLVKIDLRTNLNSAWCGDPLPLLAEWHFYHENAIAAPLIIGAKPMGPGLSLFVITELAESHKKWLHGGRLIAVELQVSFQEYLPFADTGSVLNPLGIPGFAGLGSANTGSFAIPTLPGLG
jgi:Phage P2 GpU